ncbi:uncharacterized protein [Cardiocondyla obscurior]|uniref:uncharacterized protein n=1 Tax=Cardiocondyla obscurior TaxID=286306 RepID=UPI0039655FD3
MTRERINLEEVKLILLSLLVSKRDPMTIHLLEKDYYDIEKKCIPYREFGYSNLLSFLESMPDHFIVKNENNNYYVQGITQKSKHVSSLVARQKTTNNKRFSSPRLFKTPVNHFRSKSQFKISSELLYDLIQFISEHPNGVSLQKIVMLVRQKSPHTDVSILELKAQLHAVSHKLFIIEDTIYPNEVSVLPSRNLKSPSPSRNLKSSSPSRNLRSPLTTRNSKPFSTAQTCPAGTEDYDYLEYFSEDNDYVDYVNQYQRYVEENEKSTTNFAQCANWERTDMLNHNNVNSEDSTMINNRNVKIKSLDFGQIINDRIKSRLEKLMQKYSNGILCADLPNLYLEEYKLPLRYAELGFSSVLELTSHLPNIFYVAPTNETDFMLLSADKRPVISKIEPINITSLNQCNEYSTTMQLENSSSNNAEKPLPLNISSSVAQVFAPNDVMNYNDIIGKISVTELVQQHQNKDNKDIFLEGYIVDVFHLNFFWIHLRENKKLCSVMMQELSEFYNSNRSMYTIPKIALKKDLNCACIYGKTWHRAIIKNVKPDFRVTVFFYDFGTLKTYAPEDVYYLHKKFCKLPAQAIPCTLNNIKPIVGNRWKRSVIEQFLDKIADTLLIISVIDIDPMHNSMIVDLIDTNDEDVDVCINSWLVQERLAQYGKTAPVDMASLMKYVVNSANQLPIYCYAEENLMPENCCKATLKEETAPLVTIGPTIMHYENPQQMPVKPPPGFAPIVEQHISSNLSNNTNYIASSNKFSFTDLPNAKEPAFNDVKMTTNPFLTDQQFIPNDKPVAEETYMSVWNENKKLHTTINDILYDLLHHSRLALEEQTHLNKSLQIINEVLMEQKAECLITMKGSKPENEITTNDAASAQKTFNFNSEDFAKRDLSINTFATSNPFNVNAQAADNRPQNNATFSTYGSDNFATKSSWDQSDKLNSHLQMSSTTSTRLPAPSPFVNDISSTNIFFPSINRGNSVTSMPSSDLTNTNIFQTYSNCLENMTHQFANMLKDTNPFKYSVTKPVQEAPKEQTSRSYNASILPYVSANSNPHNVPNTETTNVHTKTNYTPVGHAGENYTTKIVYESGPVMYNTQQKRVDVNAKQNACNNNLENIQSTQSFELGQDKKLTSQPANNIATSYTQHKVTNQMTKDSSQVNENYITKQPTLYTQASQPIVNNESIYYQQNSNANSLQSVFWNLHFLNPPTSEYWTPNLKPNNIPLLNRNENVAFGTPTTAFRQDWNFDGNHDKEKSVEQKEMYSSSQNNHWNPPVQKKDDSFIFKKIDSVKSVTFIFNIEDTGWMLTNEFVQTFTNFKLESVLFALLDRLNINGVFKEIMRSDYPMQFLQLDRYPLIVPRDSDRRIISLHLISLQSALILLHKLKIVSREEIENAFKKNEFLDGSVLSTLWTLIVAYRDLRRWINIYSSYT